MSHIVPHIKTIKRDLIDLSVPSILLRSIETRALRSGRRRTGKFQSNRNPRWELLPDDPQYGTKEDCQKILLTLYGMLMEFSNAPTMKLSTTLVLESYLGREVKRGTYTDPLLYEVLDYCKICDEVYNAKHGNSEFHLGHKNPQISPKHIPGNVCWQTKRSNLIQGDMTQEETRRKIIFAAKMMVKERMMQ